MTESLLEATTSHENSFQNFFPREVMVVDDDKINERDRPVLEGSGLGKSAFLTDRKMYFS